MPIPGLTDIYAFGEWLKRYYIGDRRKPLSIQPIQGGLIEVKVIEEVDDGLSEGHSQ